MSYQVTIEPIGTTIEVEEDQTILDAAYAKAFGYPCLWSWHLRDLQGSSHRWFYDVEVKPRHLHSWILNVMKIRCLPAAANHNPTWSLKPMLMKTQIS